MPAGSSWPMMATIRGPSLPRAQEHPAHGPVHRIGAGPLQGLLAGLTLGLRRLAARLRRAAEHIAGMPTRPFHDPAVRVAGTGKLGTTSASPSITFAASPARAAS